MKNTPLAISRISRPAVRASKAQKACRVCGFRVLKTYLNLGRTPLANSYLAKQALSKPEFKEALALQLCPKCGLSQLTQVVSPERMYKNYLYVSSTPATFRAHCAELAATAVKFAKLKPSDLVLDIASNDGCLLSAFRDRGMRVLGVEPAENLAPEANRKNISTLCVYWSVHVAREIAARFGRPKVITSTNVLAHVDDVHAFIAGIEAALAPHGLWIIEVPYGLDFIRKNEFDTAYHEHLSYFSLSAIHELLQRHRFEVMDIGYFPALHGGTLRVYAARSGTFKSGKRPEAWLRKERRFGVTRLAPYQAFAARVQANKQQLMRLLQKMHRDKKVVWAYGASAKGNTLLNYYGISKDLVPVAIDDNPKKWKYYTPGSRLRITGIQELRSTPVDYLLLLAWNFKDEIMKRCRVVGYKKGYILPVPRATIVSGKKG